MKSKFAGLLIVLIIFLGGCIVEPAGCEKDFSFDAPSGWKKFSENDSAVNFIRSDKNPDESPLISISKASDFAGKKYTGIEDLTENLLSAAGTEQGFTLINESGRNLGSFTAKDITISFRATGITTIVRFVVSEKDADSFYVLSLISSEESFTQDNAAFEELLISFTGCD